MPPLIEGALAIASALLFRIHIRLERTLELVHSLRIISVFVRGDASGVHFHKRRRFEINYFFHLYVRQIHVIHEALLDHLVIVMLRQKGKSRIRCVLVSRFLQNCFINYFVQSNGITCR